LQQNDFEVKLVDAPARNLTSVHMIKICEKFGPDMIVLDTSTPTIQNDVKCGSILKSLNKDAKLVLVGPHASALPQDTLDMSKDIDIVCRGEYDYTLLDIAQTFESGGDLKNVKGILFRKDEKAVLTPIRPFIQNLDSLPFVSKVYKQFLNVYDYFYSMCLYPMIQIFSSRGCPYHCTYCVWPQVLMGHQFRTRSIKNLVDEIEYIQKDLPMIEEIIMEDDTFTFDKPRLLEFCKEIQERNLDVSWTANARADISMELLKEMKKSGCRMLIVGYESGSQKLLNNVRKGIKIETMREFAINANKIGIKTMACFLIGLPGETPQTAEETYQFAKYANPDWFFFNLACPFPGTEFYAWCKEKGYLVSEDFSDWVDDEGYLECMVNYPEYSTEKLKTTVDRFAIRYVLQPQFLMMSLKKMTKDRKEIKRYIRASRHVIHYLWNARST